MSGPPGAPTRKGPTMAALLSAISAVETLVAGGADGWVETFTLRGRTLTMRHGVGASFYEGRAVFAVFNEAGRATTVTVRDADVVEVLTRRV